MGIPDFSSLALSEWANLEFECDCGRRHAVGIDRIDISIGAGLSAATQAVSMASAGRRGTNILVVGDANTLAVAGRELASLISREIGSARLGNRSLSVRSLELPARGRAELVPDEAAVGRVLIECGDAACIVAAGSGSVNDTCRFVSARTGIPYSVFATAPSMDGYASTVSPLIVDGKKITFEAAYPRGIFADPRILAAAPALMLRAGFGDILGKYTALADWRLARELTGEYHCPRMEALVERAIERCVAPVREGRGIDPVATTEALVLSGLVMGMTGNSRPASGAEHHMAHYWETAALAAGREHPLHGNSVGVATRVIAELYRRLGSLVPAGVNPPDPAVIRDLLRGAGYGGEYAGGGRGAGRGTGIGAGRGAAEGAESAPTGDALGPAGLGIPRDVFYEGVLHAMEIRERFTALRLADSGGLLERAARELTEEFYTGRA